MRPGLIAYSEATRYTKAKYLETVAWCRAHSRPIPQHTLYPRTKGFISTVQQLRQTAHVKAVYDLTVVYAYKGVFMEAPDMWQTLSQPRLSPAYRFHVHAERFLLDSLPTSDEDLAKWLEQRWIEKGRKLESLRVDMKNGLGWGRTDEKTIEGFSDSPPTQTI